MTGRAMHTRGNIYAMLFAAVALTGVLAKLGMETLTGPVTTITRVTQKNIADNNLLMNAKIIVTAAVTGASGGDADGDGIIEPAPFVPAGAGETPPLNGGFLPTTLGLTLTDPWGSKFGYCVWDHGTTNASTGRIAGDNTASAATQPVLALIAAGPDKTFQTTCSAYAGGPVTVAKAGGSDDLIFRYSYAEATASSNGLWSLNPTDQTKAQLKDAGGTANVTIDRATGIGDFLGVTTDSLVAKNDAIAIGGGLKLDTEANVTACGVGEAGTVRYNGAAARIEVCNGALWKPAGTADATFITQTPSADLANEQALSALATGIMKVTTGTGIISSGAVDLSGAEATGVLAAARFPALTGEVTTTAGSLTTTVADDVLDFSEFKDAMTLDAATDIAASGTNVLSITNSGTGNSFVVNDQASDTSPFLIDAAGNVGIGLTSPDDTLDVLGTFDLSTADGGTFVKGYGWSSLGLSGGNHMTFNVVNNNGYYFNTGSTTRVRITQVGDVGIGTTTPATRLDVAGGARVGTDAVCNAGKAGTIAWNASQLQVCDGTGFQNLRSVQKLDDIGDVYLSESGSPEPNNNEVLAWNATSDRWEAKSINTVGSAIATPGGSDKQVQFNDGGTLAGASQLYWDKANNRLGIGTAAPATMLDVRGVLTITGSNGSGGLLQLNSPGGVNRSNLYLRNDGLARWDIGADFSSETGANEGKFYINRFNDAGSYIDTVLLADRASGYIGLGTNTPASKLHVAGGIQLADDTATCPGTSNVKLGTMRFSGGDLQVCKSGGWSAVSSGGDSDTLASLSCATGEIAKYNGSAWACAADGGGSGSDVLNGTWLSSGGITEANGATLVPANGSYNLGNMQVEKGVYLWLLYNCGGQLTYSGPSIGNSIDIVGPTVITSSDTWADLSNVPYNSCGIFYTGIFKSSGSGTASVRIRSYFNSPNYSVLVKSSAAAFSARVIKISGGNGSGGGSSQWTDVTDGLSYASGGAVVGASSLNASAILQADSTAKGFLPPRMTTPQRDAIVSPAPGLMIFNMTAGQYQFWTGTAWTGLGGNASVPTGTIAAFQATSCPTGWTEYTAARGRFLRGIDNGAGNDPTGTRAPGSVQADDIKSHLHSVDPPSTATNSAGAHAHTYNRPNITASYRNNLESGSNGNQTVTAGASTSSDGAHTHAVDIAAFDSASTGGVETRPKNVAVLFCQYSGSGGGGGVTTLADLTDVDLSAVANGKVLTYNNMTSKWEAAMPSGVPAGFVTGAVQFRGSSAVFAADDANLVWDDTNNRLGIGTTAPRRSLDVAGSIVAQNRLTLASDATTTSPVWNIDSDADTFRLFREPNFSTPGTVFMTILNNGNVGIGTTAPMGPLHVVDNGGSGRFYFDTYGTNGNALILRAARPGPSGVQAGDQMAAFGARPYAGSNFVPGATSVISIVATENQTATAQGNAIAFTTTNNGTAAAAERMRIDQNGNVGIGTAAPSAKLHVFGGGNVDPSLSYGSSATTIINGGGQDIAFGGALAASPWSAWMQVRGWSSTAGNLAINPLGGNVGIGTTNPADKLEVSGSGIRVSVPSADPWPFTLYRSDTDRYWYLFNNSGLHFYYRPTTGGTPTAKLSILENGNVGIGTISPGSQLHINNSSGAARITLSHTSGTSYIFANTNNTLVLQQNSNGVYLASGATSWTSNSDERLKTDIAPLPDEEGLAAILRLRPVTYKWKDPNYERGTQIGFIAQDIVKVYPTLVSLGEPTQFTPNGTMGVAYTGLIAPLVRAVQELKAANDNLQQELRDTINSQDEEIEALRKEIETLKASRL